MNEDIFRISIAIIFFTSLSISIYHRRKADRDSGEQVSTKDEGKPIFLALRLGGLVIWLSPVAYLISPAWMAWSKLNLSDWARWLGIVVGFICVGLIYWVFSSIGMGISSTVATRREHQLVTSGPYRWVRHPLYVVGTALFLSLGMIADSWFIMILAVIGFVLLARRTSNEEAHLMEKFDEAYREYMKRTGRFMPKIG